MKVSKFELKKINKKSKIYENEIYIIRLKENYGLAFPPEKYRCDDDNILQYFDLVEIKNKSTGKETNKRMFQANPILDIENDLLFNNKQKFCSTIWNKID